MNLATNWVYSHIPKTGGTSFENYLAQLFLLQDILHVNAPDLNKMPEVMQLKKQIPRYMAGHHPMHGLLYQLLADEKLIHLTILRDPVSRVLSYYNYLSTRTSHVLHDEMAGLDIDVFLRKDNLVELHNGQARRLAGLLHSNAIISDGDLFKRAKYVVDHCFTLVGTTEKLEHLLSLIEKKCDVTFHRTPRKNHSDIRVARNQLNPEQISTINNNNRVDQKLYEYVCEIFNQKYNDN